MSLGKYTCAELRTMLRNRNLKISGTKQELIERLEEFRESEILTLRRELDEMKRELRRTKKEFVEVYQAELNHEGYNRPHVYLRFACVGLLAAYIITSSKLLEMRDHVDSIADIGHDITEPLSDWMEEHPVVRNTIIIAHGLLMDSLCALVIYLGVFHDDTMRLHVALVAFYTMRNVCQNLMRFPLPDKWRFYDPGLPSILISYEECSDFYFSGHVGAVVMSALEFQRREYYTMANCLRMFACVIALIVITTRAHYTVDVIDGVIFAFVATRFAHNYTRYVDHFFSKIGSMMGLKPTRGDIRFNGDDDEKTFARVRKNMYIENGHRTW